MKKNQTTADQALRSSPWLEPMSQVEQQQLQVLADDKVSDPDSSHAWQAPEPATTWLEYAGIAKALAWFVGGFVGLQGALMVASAWSYHWLLGLGAATLVAIPSAWLGAKLWRARRNGKRVEALARVRILAEQMIASEAEEKYAHYRAATESVLPLTSAMFSGQPSRLGDYANITEKLQDLDRQLVQRCDNTAIAEVVRATRRTALGVAASPFLALDLVMALAGNMALIGRVAKAYGLAPSPFLEAQILVHVYRQIAAMGAIELGSEVAGQTLSHEVISKLSGRVAQGFSAGIYTYRIGVTAMALCRPLAFSATTKPKPGKVFKDLFSRLEADELN